MYLTAGVVALGLAAYLASFGPLLSINTNVGPFGGAEFTASGLSYWTVAALLAALLAAVGLLPKSKNYSAVVAVTAVLGVLLALGQVFNRPKGFSIGWALWLVLAFTLLQAIAAVAALLFEAGVLTLQAPRPRYEQYGQYGPRPAGITGSREATVRRSGPAIRRSIRAATPRRRCQVGQVGMPPSTARSITPRRLRLPGSPAIRRQPRPSQANRRCPQSRRRVRRRRPDRASHATRLKPRDE